MMSDKYTNLIGQAHLKKEVVRQKLNELSESELLANAKNTISTVRNDAINNYLNGGDNTYEHLYRRKSRWEMVRISAAVMGIEFSYAAETAFVSPTLLKIGVKHEHMTMIWCLSPLLGFILTPIMGSMSDRCGSSLGRRRPFILLLSIGVILGLILVPNGKWIGQQMGDRYIAEEYLYKMKLNEADLSETPWSGPGGRLHAKGQDDTEINLWRAINRTLQNGKLSSAADIKAMDSYYDESKEAWVGKEAPSHAWGIFFTILGTILLDFDADACQSPSRAYLLDVTLPEDHAAGLSTFTVLAGLGGSIGYCMGAIDWGLLGDLFGGHLRFVFTSILLIFIACVAFTVTSFAEIPLRKLEAQRHTERRRESSVIHQQVKRRQSSVCNLYTNNLHEVNSKKISVENIALNLKPVEGGGDYGAIGESPKKVATNNPFRKKASIVDVSNSESRKSSKSGTTKLRMDSIDESNTGGGYPKQPSLEEGDAISDDRESHMATFRQYIKSIVHLPNSLKMLCLTNFFCWMSLVCYSLYFTDFVGEAVFGGDPKGKIGSAERKLYDDGVRFGCWGMAVYSLSCSIYSFNIDYLITRFGGKKVYICGQLVYSVGMVFMALTRSKWGVIVLSSSAGIMYSTLFTMPYLLVARYHELDEEYSSSRRRSCSKVHDTIVSGGKADEDFVRGIGTDVALVSCMVFLAQFILSATMGSIIAIFNSTVVVVVSAAILSACGAITANFVSYCDM